MKNLLDSNVWIEVLRQRRKRTVLNRIRALPEEEIVTSAVVKGELYAAALKSSNPGFHLNQIEELLGLHTVLAFDERDAFVYATVRRALEQRGLAIGHNDLMTAATAMQHDLTLVTHNTREFSRVPGLRVEDWQGPTAADPLA